MSHCYFCTLLCELPLTIANNSPGLMKMEPMALAKGLDSATVFPMPPEANTLTVHACELRKQKLAQLSVAFGRKDCRSPRMDGKIVSMTEAIQATQELITRKTSPSILITGEIQTVETSRAVINFASKHGAIVDPAHSDAAFDQILAIQRHGAMTASLSEVRFRSDCVVLVGDDGILKSMPRLPHVLSSQRDVPRRIVLMGNWSDASIELFRSLSFEVEAIQMDYCDFPAAIRDWSRLSQEERSQSKSKASQWMEKANYLAIVWVGSNLQTPTNDLWIEQLLGWIADQNSSRRVVGVPLAGSYQTFQQVATWITGFPGRMQLQFSNLGDLLVEFRPHQFRREVVANHKPTPTTIRIDDSLSQDSQTAKESISSDILIAPVWPEHFDQTGISEQIIGPKIFLPCKLGFHELVSQVFRADSVYSVKIDPASRLDASNAPETSTSLSSIAELLELISSGDQP